MRLWSIHPSYLDAKALTACWREGLLARKVLLGQTRGYTAHPQLSRFRDADDPVATIDAYLNCIYLEAKARGYKFDKTKIGIPQNFAKLKVTTGQLEYEFKHLLSKLAVRSTDKHIKLKDETVIIPHPLFTSCEGDCEDWEIIR